jgi:hypothetical protein
MSEAEKQDKPDIKLVEELDEEEKEFRKLRRDLPGVHGAAAAGIVAIGVHKDPIKNEFFRTHPDFRPIVQIVVAEVGLERQFFAVAPNMVEPLTSIGINIADHTLYLIITPRGAMRAIPIRCPGPDGEQNEYSRTKELALLQGMDEWVRIYSDLENKAYRVFTAPAGRFADPQWPPLKSAKLFRLMFRDKGRLLDSTEHSLFKRWAARDEDAKNAR